VADSQDIVVPSGVHTGPFLVGERVSLSDPKGRRHSVLLAPGGSFHTTKGRISHDDLIGAPEGSVVRSAGGVSYLAFRQLLEEFTVTMPRGAAVVYPKDAAHILVQTDIFPGARVLEAGAGSGALTMFLLRAVGVTGRVYSYERRDDFAAIATKNVETFFGGPHPAWTLRVGDLVETIGPEPIDRAVLDMLAPWECVDVVADRLAMSPPRPSWGARSRPSACTAASPSRKPGSTPRATGTPRGWRSVRDTAPAATPDS